MAAISSFGVTFISRRVIDASPSFQEVHATLQIGDGTSTYPTGGVALNGPQLGLPNGIYLTIPVDINITGGYTPKYNQTTSKLQFFDNVGVEMLTSVTPNSALNILVRGF